CSPTTSSTCRASARKARWCASITSATWWRSVSAWGSGRCRWTRFSLSGGDVDSATEQLYPEVEERLQPLARPLGRPRAGDWLAEHWEPGQTFTQYRDARPVRRSDRLRAIYLCLVGAFGAPQQRLVDLARESLALFYDVPV